ncbi:MAG: glucokinase, partial [Gemmatimonadota bacterium]
MRVLAGDVGGTSARLALVDVDGDRATILHRQDYSSTRYPGLAPIVQEYLATLDQPPENACIGVPCPIDEGICTLANLNWVLDLGSFRRETGLKAALLINDFAALGHAIGFLQPADLVTIFEGTRVPMATMGIIGAGTGLGQGGLVWDGERYRVVASEGGHVDFAPRNEEEIALLRF